MRHFDKDTGAERNSQAERRDNVIDDNLGSHKDTPSLTSRKGSTSSL